MDNNISKHRFLKTKRLLVSLSDQRLCIRQLTSEGRGCPTKCSEQLYIGGGGGIISIQPWIPSCRKSYNKNHFMGMFCTCLIRAPLPLLPTLFGSVDRSETIAYSYIDFDFARLYSTNRKFSPIITHQ